MSRLAACAGRPPGRRPRARSARVCRSARPGQRRERGPSCDATAPLSAGGPPVLRDPRVFRNTSAAAEGAGSLSERMVRKESPPSSRRGWALWRTSCVRQRAHPQSPSTNRIGGRPLRNESAHTPSPHCPARSKREARAESAGPRAARSGTRWGRGAARVGGAEPRGLGRGAARVGARSRARWGAERHAWGRGAARVGGAERRAPARRAPPPDAGA